MMANKRRQSESKGDARARAKILTEWRGGIDPPDPARNIHQPGEFMQDLLKVIGLSEGIEEQKLKEIWNRIAGDFVAKHTVPESIRDGILILRVLQPTMKFHLQQMSGKLLENLRRELGSSAIRQVIFKIG